MNKYQEKYLPEFVLGATDGLITTFAIVSGVMGASLSSGIILILGFSNLLADGFSMGASNYLSKESENDLLKNKTDKKDSPFKVGMMTFLSFVLVGIVPLMPFLSGHFLEMDNKALFNYSIVLTGLLFIIIGLFRGIVTKKSMTRSSLETFFIGSSAAIISYCVGALLRGVVN